MGTDVNGVIGPVLQRDDRHVSAVTDDHLDIGSERAGADVVEHDRRLGVVVDLDDEVPMSKPAGTLDLDGHPGVGLLGRHGDQPRFA